MRATQLWVTDSYEVTLQSFEVPSSPPDGHVLIETERSLISTGNELALVMGTHIGFTGGAAWPRYPLAPHHAAGSDVSPSLRIVMSASNVYMSFPALLKNCSRKQRIASKTSASVRRNSGGSYVDRTIECPPSLREGDARMGPVGPV
jgi:hypothetical protein